MQKQHKRYSALLEFGNRFNSLPKEKASGLSKKKKDVAKQEMRWCLLEGRSSIWQGDRTVTVIVIQYYEEQKYTVCVDQTYQLSMLPDRRMDQECITMNFKIYQVYNYQRNIN